MVKKLLILIILKKALVSCVFSNTKASKTVKKYLKPPCEDAFEFLIGKIFTESEQMEYISKHFNIECKSLLLEISINQHEKN